MANTEERGWWMDTSTVWPSLHSSLSVPMTCRGGGCRKQPLCNQQGDREGGRGAGRCACWPGIPLHAVWHGTGPLKPELCPPFQR